MKTYASFYDIAEGVKAETGISNLVNRYNEMINLIVRAERDINPFAGHFIRKKLRFKIGSGAFNGKNIKLPNDFVEGMGVYNGMGENRCEFETIMTPTHAIICNGGSHPVAILDYWAVQMDPEGHPFVPYTHYEAVVSFIIWKLYSQRHFQDKGNLNTKMNFQDIYERFARAARGFDFFPDQDSMNNMTSRLNIPTMFDIIGDDGCFCACGIIDDNTPPEPEKLEIWYWQENSLSQGITLPDVTNEFLEDQEKISEASFKSGTYFTSTYIGRYGIAIQNGPTTPAPIIDALGSSIEPSVEWIYDESRKMLILISKNYITPGTFFLKLT